MHTGQWSPANTKVLTALSSQTNVKFLPSLDCTAFHYASQGLEKQSERSWYPELMKAPEIVSKFCENFLISKEDQSKAYLMGQIRPEVNSLVGETASSHTWVWCV